MIARAQALKGAHLVSTHGGATVKETSSTLDGTLPPSGDALTHPVQTQNPVPLTGPAWLAALPKCLPKSRRGLLLTAASASATWMGSSTNGGRLAERAPWAAAAGVVVAAAAKGIEMVGDAIAERRAIAMARETLRFTRNAFTAPTLLRPAQRSEQQSLAYYWQHAKAA